MANYVNVFIGLLTFVLATGMALMTWQPIINFLAYFPSPLNIFIGATYVAFLGSTVLVAPYLLIISDDRGN